MITYIRGDLFESPAKVLVNTVNTKGVMGKGIALRFKRIYPDMFKIYRERCKQGRFNIGQLLQYETPNKWILNFPTKEHWRNPSRVDYIEAGLHTFATEYAKSYIEDGITSIAFPALGCGNGELDFESQVNPIMAKYLQDTRLEVFIYPGLADSGDTVQTDAWLRTEPAAILFADVWLELRQALDVRNRFKMPADGSTYTVRATECPLGLTVTLSSGIERTIDTRALTRFWDRLCRHGFIHGDGAPHDYWMKHLIPVFEQLPCLRRVDWSGSVKGLKTNPSVGLQIIPHQPATDWTQSVLLSR